MYAIIVLQGRMCTEPIKVDCVQRPYAKIDGTSPPTVFRLLCSADGPAK